VHRTQDLAIVMIHNPALDLSIQDELEALLINLLDSGVCRLILDLSEVAFIDSTTVSALIRAQRRARAGNGWIRLTGTVGQPHNLLEVTNVSRLMPSFASSKEAIAADDKSVG